MFDDVATPVLDGRPHFVLNALLLFVELPLAQFALLFLLLQKFRKFLLLQLEVRFRLWGRHQFQRRWLRWRFHRGRLLGGFGLRLLWGPLDLFELDGLQVFRDSFFYFPFRRTLRFLD